MTDALDFLALFGAALVANLAAYFGLGRLLTAINARRPDRRIQPDRDGMARARQEIRESVISIAVTALCLSLALFLQLKGWTLFAPWSGWVGLLAGLALLVALYDAWFYWGHRLLHTRALYALHRDHHRAVAPTVWSSDSQSVGETALLQGFMIVAALLLPIPPLALVLHRIYDHANGQIGHAGFEYFADRTTRFPSPLVCPTFHDQHHELFRWNYANYFSLWDRAMGTLHPGYDARVEDLSKPGPAETPAATVLSRD